MILYQKCTTFDRSFQNILTEAKSIRIVKVGGHDSHLPFSLTYHRRFQFTDFFSYPLNAHIAIVFTIYMMLSVVKRRNEDDKTTEAQLEEFTSSFIGHLPKYMQDALSGAQSAA